MEFSLMLRRQRSRIIPSLETVQEKRDVKRVPGGLALHEYANVYFHARNPMMSTRRNEAHRLCVLRVSPEILNVPGAVIADQNAASKYVRFLAPDRHAGLESALRFRPELETPGRSNRGMAAQTARSALK